MDYVDAYWNVSLDSVSALKFSLALIDASVDLDFVLLGDDDTFVNIPALWGLLYDEKKIDRVREKEREVNVRTGWPGKKVYSIHTLTASFSI